MYNSNTIRHAIDAFTSFVADKTGRPSDDTAWPPKLVFYYLNINKNAVIFEKRFQETLRNVSESTIVTLPCVELKEIDRNECPCAPASGCLFQKSIHPLPKPLEDKIIGVYNPLGNKSYDFVKWQDFEGKINSRIEAQSRHPYYTLRNINSKRHLYIYNDEFMRSATVLLIPSDPVEAAQFPNCGETVLLCNPQEEEFNIDQELQPLIFERTFESLARMKSFATGDVLNNKNDDTAAQVPLK